ncbi:MBL fold metallo-hydrolase [Bacillus solimangrovi]|uniref:Metallo-beta-lactamase domain-containing protein n=1 Tax=Bacillus solimangrovi TaxID=1305675 RepID=A0A1E5LE91_9BACI|nr:MBL fold metallo-hydrolase [Bacillus solimangrovi]OEH92407.1 hypothetical protein BFG57_15980 [Bacillus solimangrovi]
MKVTVIGYWGGYPKRNEATSGYLIEHEGFNLLVDCGSGVLSQLQNYIKITQLDAVILSHYHHDHIADIGVLQYAQMIKRILGETNKTLPIYGHASDQDNYSKLTKSADTKGIAYDPDEALTIGPFTITFLETDHPVTCYAMKITVGNVNVVYTADTSYKADFIPFAQNANLLIAESNFYHGMDGKSAGHMMCTEAATIASKAEVNQLLLTHLPHFGQLQDLEQAAKKVYEGSLSLASTGWQWES